MNGGTKPQARHSSTVSQLVLGLALMVGLYGACTDRDFEGCRATLTCPMANGGATASTSRASGAGGSAGARQSGPAGAAGDSGESTTAGGGQRSSGSGSDLVGAGGAEAACQRDADCSNGEFCTLEACENGVCVQRFACVTGDSVHCQAVCDEQAEECSIRARDADGDGAGSVLCAEAAGTDCDDAATSVQPGALEACDGVDNDCNGRADGADGLALAGTTQSLDEGWHVDVAWSPLAMRFVATYVYIGEDGVGSVRWGRLAGDGSIGERSELTTLGSASTLREPTLAWGDDRFGLTVNDASGYTFATVTSVGTTGSATTSTGVALDLAFRSSGDWLVAVGWQRQLRVDLAADRGGISVAALLALEPVDYGRLATRSTEHALLWLSGESPFDVGWASVSATLELSEPLPLAQQVGGPDIAALPDGYAMAWPTAQGLSLSQLSASGGLRCGPTQVPSAAGLGADEARLVVHGNELLVLMTRASGQVALFRFDRDCEVLDQFIVTDTADTPARPRLAVGGGQVALAWTEAGAGGTFGLQGKTRLVGDLLCQ